jgi:hypothetical protein
LKNSYESIKNKESINKIIELSELLSRYSHGISIDKDKKYNIFEVLLLIGQIEDYKFLEIKYLEILESIIKSLKRILLFKNK